MTAQATSSLPTEVSVRGHRVKVSVNETFSRPGEFVAKNECVVDKENGHIQCHKAFGSTKEEALSRLQRQLKSYEH